MTPFACSTFSMPCDPLRNLWNRTQDDLDDDEQLQFALARAIEIVGEAASKLSQDFRDSHPEIPWPLIIGMRNRLVHALPELAGKLRPLLGK